MQGTIIVSGLDAVDIIVTSLLLVVKRVTPVNDFGVSAVSKMAHFTVAMEKKGQPSIKRKYFDKPRMTFSN